MKVTIISLSASKKAYLVADDQGRKAYYPKHLVAYEGKVGTVPDHPADEPNSFEARHKSYMQRELERAATQAANPAQEAPKEKTPQQIALAEEKQAAKNEFLSRVLPVEGTLPLLSAEEKPAGAKSMMASIRDGVDGPMRAVAQIIVPKTETSAESKYTVYVQATEATLQEAPAANSKQAEAVSSVTTETKPAPQRRRLR